jgi:TorA maturation chaperone TorD
MDETQKQDMLASCAPRASFYRFLASLFLYEPTTEQIETMAHAELPTDGTGEIERGYAQIAEYLRHRDQGTRQEIAVDYARTFLGAGHYETITAPPYESVFTSEDHLLMQDARDGALAYYRSEDLDLPAENTTPEDHVGFEMQFMATLIERMAAAIEAGDDERARELVERQRGFFDEHLANWLPAFAQAIDANCKTDFYHGVAHLTRGLLDEERAVLDELAEPAR